MKKINYFLLILTLVFTVNICFSNSYVYSAPPPVKKEAVAPSVPLPPPPIADAPIPDNSVGNIPTDGVSIYGKIIQFLAATLIVLAGLIVLVTLVISIIKSRKKSVKKEFSDKTMAVINFVRHRMRF